jgi:electron transport complex protein RnfE
MKNELSKAIFKENPLFGFALGLCPALAVTTGMLNALEMSLAVIFVLIFSNFIIATTRKVIPYKIRIPFYIIVTATFTTIVEIIAHSVFPFMEKELGIFIPLIAVNCIILGRAESFASKNKVGASIVDGIATGIGFAAALLFCALIREIFGKNKLFGLELIHGMHGISFFSLACGGFISLGLILAGITYIRQAKGKL